MSEPSAVPAQSRYRGPRVVIVFLVLAFAFATLLVVVRNKVRVPPKPIPTLAAIPDVPLRDPEGAQTSFSALQGKVMIIDLQTADCGAPCQDRNLQMQEMQAYITPVSKSMRQVTIFSEPLAPGLLSETAKRLEARDTWLWFSTDAASFAALKQVMTPDASANLALVDGQGRVRRRFHTDNRPERRELLLDSRVLIREMNALTSGNTASATSPSPSTSP